MALAAELSAEALHNLTGWFDVLIQMDLYQKYVMKLGVSTMKIRIYMILQKSLRKCIDWLLTLWLWADKHEKSFRNDKNDSK